MKKLFFVLLILGTSALTYAQSKPIKGTITDAQGIPMGGVVISVKSNPGNKVVSKANGVYQINVLDVEKGVLVFSFVGKDPDYPNSPQPANPAGATYPLPVPLLNPFSGVIPFE